MRGTCSWISAVAALMACRRPEQLQATADDASVRDVAQDTSAAVYDADADAGHDVDMTAHATVVLRIHEPDPGAALKLLPDQWLPGRYKEVASFKVEPYLGEHVRQRLPDGTIFEFDVYRMMNAGTWSGTAWVHHIVLIEFQKSGTAVPCRGTVNPHTERIGLYSVVVLCDASRVPTLVATGPAWLHRGPPSAFVDAGPPG